MTQARRKPTYNLSETLPADLHREGKPDLLSTHLTLQGAFRALRAHNRWATHGMKYQNARIVAYITTEKDAKQVQGDIHDLTLILTHTQRPKLVVWKMPQLTPYVPRNQQLPMDRDRDQRQIYRQARALMDQRATERQALEQFARELDAPLGNPTQKAPETQQPTLAPEAIAPITIPRPRQAFTILPHAHPSQQPAASSDKRVSTHRSLLTAYKAYRLALGYIPACIVTERNPSWVQEQIQLTTKGNSASLLKATPIKVYLLIPPEFHGDQPTYELIS